VALLQRKKGSLKESEEKILSESVDSDSLSQLDNSRFETDPPMSGDGSSSGAISSLEKTLT